jgi:hypothetical protein
MMVDSAEFAAHGLRFRITSPDAAVIDTFDDLLIDMRADNFADGPCHRIRIEPVPASDTTSDTVDDTRSDTRNEATAPCLRVQFDDQLVHEALMEGSLISHVLMDVNRRVARAVWSAGSIALHASTVAGPSGAIVLAGASYSGKSTLAAALALVGGGERTTFFADEVTALHPADLVVTPYGKPAALRPPALDLLAPMVPRLQHPGTRFERDERFVPPSELGGRPAAATRAPARTPARVAAIVFPRFTEPRSAGVPTEASLPTAELAIVRPGEALMRLMRLTLANDSVDHGTFRSLERLVRHVKTHELVFTDALAAAERLGAALDPGAHA